MKTSDLIKVSICLFLLLLNLQSWAALNQSRFTVDSLKGLKTISGVVVEEFDKFAVDMGLIKEGIESAYIKILKREGFNISENSNSPYVYIQINVTKEAFSIGLYLFEDVIITRLSKHDITPTWISGITDIHNGEIKKITYTLALVFREFVDAWNYANQK